MPDSSLDRLRLACAAPLSTHSTDWLRRAGHDVMDAMLADHLALGGGRVGNTASRPEMELLLREPPPEDGMELAPLLAELQAKVIGKAFRTNHPRFLAFIPGAPTFEAILGDALAANANLFAGVWKEAAGATQVEIVLLDWFKHFLGYPHEARGILTSGGSEANLTALVVAREHLSFSDRHRAVLYASEHRHWSIDRAAKIIGLHEYQIRTLSCDAECRLWLDELKYAIADDETDGKLPWLVIANAGTTNTGSVDPLDAIADLCASRRLWMHVDAAYGWPICLTDEGKSLMKGIERADSITLDPHKWFAQPFEAGGLLIRDGARLTETFMMRPEYMQDVVPNADELNFCDHGIALTRRFRALKIWFSIKLLGMSWFRRLIEHCCNLAAYAEAILKKEGFAITSSRKLSVVCFRYIPTWRADADMEELCSPTYQDWLQSAIAEALMKDGRAFISTTRLGGQSTLRFCFVNARTTAADVEMIVGLLKEIGKRLENA